MCVYIVTDICLSRGYDRNDPVVGQIHPTYVVEEAWHSDGIICLTFWKGYLKVVEPAVDVSIF